MTEPQRISYVPLEEMTPEMQAEMERCAREGTPRPESTAVRAHVPAAFWFFANSWNDLFRDGIVDHPLKELCRVYVSRSVKCEYCGNQRSEKGREGGLVEGKYDELLNFESLRDATASARRPRSPTPRRSSGPATPTTRSGSGCTRTSARRSSSSSAA